MECWSVGALECRNVLEASEHFWSVGAFERLSVLEASERLSGGAFLERWSGGALEHRDFGDYWAFGGFRGPAAVWAGFVRILQYGGCPFSYLHYYITVSVTDNVTSHVKKTAHTTLLFLCTIPFEFFESSRVESESSPGPTRTRLEKSKPNSTRTRLEGGNSGRFEFEFQVEKS